MPPTHTHTSLLCRKQHSLFNYSWNGQLMPPHKTSRAHICSAFNQCVSPQIALPAAPFSLVPFSRSLSIVIPIHSTPFPFAIPFPIHIIILIIIIIIVIHITSRGHRLHEQASLPCTSHPLNTHTHTHTHIIESIIHHASRNWSDLSALFRLKIKRLVRSSRAVETIEAHQRQTMACFAFSALRVYLSVHSGQSTPTPFATTITATTPWPWPRGQYPHDYFTFISRSLSL